MNIFRLCLLFGTFMNIFHYVHIYYIDLYNIIIMNIVILRSLVAIEKSRSPPLLDIYIVLCFFDVYFGPIV